MNISPISFVLHDALLVLVTFNCYGFDNEPDWLSTCEHYFYFLCTALRGRYKLMPFNRILLKQTKCITVTKQLRSSWRVHMVIAERIVLIF